MRCGNSHFPCASQKSAVSGTAEGSARHAKGCRATGPGGLLAAWVPPTSPARGPAALPVRGSALGAAHGAGPCFPAACRPWRWAGGSRVPIATAARLGPFSFLFPEPGCWGRQRLRQTGACHQRGCRAGVLAGGLAGTSMLVLLIEGKAGQDPRGLVKVGELQGVPALRPRAALTAVPRVAVLQCKPQRSLFYLGIFKGIHNPKVA